MFTEMNKLKGLIIGLRTFSDDQVHEWNDIVQEIPCTFIARDEVQRQLLLSKVNGDYHSIVYATPLFSPRLTTQALGIMNLQPYEVAYVSASFQELDWMLNEPFGTVLIHPDDPTIDYFGKIPDFKIKSIVELKEIIRNPLHGYFSEVFTTNIAPTRGKFLSLHNKGYAIVNQYPDDYTPYTLVSGGRYFGHDHVRHQSHQLSCRILKSKYNNNQENLFSQCFYALIRFTNERIGKVDGVTRIPPRPGRPDRFSGIIQRICEDCGSQNLCNNLLCVQDYPPQKALSREERMENVKGVFLASKVKGMHVAIIDDLFTTGATATECVRMLYSQGASRVTVVVLGINQFDVVWRQPNKLPCQSPSCDGHMVMKFYGNDKNVMFGCTNYSSNNCASLKYVDGWKHINQLNGANSLENEDEELIF